jgi:hypothetical protein
MTPIRLILVAAAVAATAAPAAAQSSVVRSEALRVARAAGTPAGAPSAAPTTSSTSTRTPAAPAPTAAAPAAPATAAAAPGDSVRRGGTRSVAVNVAGTGSEQPAPGDVTLYRETFAYAGRGRRDPFVSLMTTGELRPMIADLLLVGVAYDHSGRNSVAIMRDVTTKEQYRVRVGQGIGRMRVARIQPKQVVFTIEEFGFSRQEVLALGDSTKARTK